MSDPLFYLLELIGTFVFAISGGLKATRHNLDLLGILVLAILTGVGGGILRDVLLGATPPAVFQDELYLLVCVLGGLLAFWTVSHLEPFWREMMIADAVGLGVFAGIGALKAHAFDLGPIGIIMMAGLTATGGGVIRDVLVREIPAVLEKDFYATAALAGGLCFLGAMALGSGETLALFLTATITTSLRFYAMFSKIDLPRAKRS
jgi:uncharacterized membrane protein YeiH